MSRAASIFLVLLAITFTAPAGAQKSKIVYFDYNEFIAVRSLDPTLSEARLCGLNKVCMKLWKNGELMVPEHGMVVRADFDSDGVTDVGVAMERDKTAPAEGADYFMVTATKKDGAYKLLETVPLEKARSIVESYWDLEKRAIAVDTGERELISESTGTMQSDGKLLTSFTAKTGTVEAKLKYLRWDKKTGKFAIRHGVLKSKSP